MTGRVRLAPNIAGFDRMDVASAPETALGCDVLLENDVNLALQGEAWQGAGQGLDDLAFIALGTGIGGGLVVGGELVPGADDAAGESASSRTAPTPSRRSRFEPGLPSGRSLRPAFGVAMPRSPSGLRSRFPKSSPEPQQAIWLPSKWSTRPRDFSRGIAAIATIANPRLVVLGGSIGSRPELIARVQPNKRGPQAEIIAL